METTQEKMLRLLGDRGMFPDDAKAVLELAKPELEKAGRITWNRPASEYPDVMYGAMMLTISQFALQWIDKNCPQAWYRDMFETTKETHDESQ